MKSIKGYYSKVESVEPVDSATTRVNFTCGSSHLMSGSLLGKVDTNDFLMVDSHGSKWVKVD